MQSVLALADSQLIAGIAILTSGYYSLTCGLSVYHWQTVVHLGWFSCLTHLSTLSALRTYLHLNKAARAWRLFLMTVLAILVFLAFIPTAHFEFFRGDPTDPTERAGGTVDLGSGPVWFDKDGYIDESAERLFYLGIYVFKESPAICFFRGGWIFLRTPCVSMTLSLVLLGYGFSVRVGKLFKRSSTKLSELLYQGIEKGCNWCIDRWAKILLHLQLKPRLLVLKISIPFISAFWGTIRLLFEVYSSMALEVFLQCIDPLCQY